jgi:hypothetical protein
LCIVLKRFAYYTIYICEYAPRAPPRPFTGGYAFRSF